MWRLEEPEGGSALTRFPSVIARAAVAGTGTELAKLLHQETWRATLSLVPTRQKPKPQRKLLAAQLLVASASRPKRVGHPSHARTAEMPPRKRELEDSGGRPGQAKAMRKGGAASRTPPPEASEAAAPAAEQTPKDAMTAEAQVVAEEKAAVDTAAIMDFDNKISEVERERQQVQDATHPEVRNSCQYTQLSRRRGSF